MTAAQDPVRRDQLLNLDYAHANATTCLAAGNDIAKNFLIPPPNGTMWEETKPKSAEKWFNSPVADGEYSLNSQKITLYCGRAQWLWTAGQYSRFVPDLWCDGREGSIGLHIQRKPAYFGGSCQGLQKVESQRWGAITKYCGCKNQPPTLPAGAQAITLNSNV